MRSCKKIAIVGAGPSGLVSAKEAILHGLKPTVFEKCPQLGGVWNPITGSVWNTMRTNLSKFTTGFGDFQWQQDADMFPTVPFVIQYLNNYADHWNLRKHIKFQCTVKEISPIRKIPSDIPIGTHGWQVSWVDDSSGTLSTENFDGIICATGIFARENIPEIPGLGSFSGQIMHSKHYKTGAAFANKRILVVGGSFSGVEIASDVASYSDSCHHCFRRPFWILRRFLSSRSKESDAKLPLDLVFYNRTFYLKSKPQVPASKEEITKKKNSGTLKFCENQQKLPELKISEEDFSKPFNVVISDHYITQVEDKRLIPIQQTIKEITKTSVLLNNGQSVDNVDTIIFATGMRCDISFFSDDVLQKFQYDETDQLKPLILFNETFHPDISNVFFVGMFKGPYFAIMEQQARLACRILSEKVNLPPKAEMKKELCNELAIREEVPRPQFPRPDYVLFCDTLAKLTRSFPDLEKLQNIQCSLEESLLTTTTQVTTDKDKILAEIKQLEHRKNEIAKTFMTAPTTTAHYYLVEHPLETVKQFSIIENIIKPNCKGNDDQS